MWSEKIICHTHYILLLIRHPNDDLTVTIISPSHRLPMLRSGWSEPHLGSLDVDTPFSHTRSYHRAHSQHKAPSDLCLSSAMVTVSCIVLSSLKMTTYFPKHKRQAAGHSLNACVITFGS